MCSVTHEKTSIQLASCIAHDSTKSYTASTMKLIKGCEEIKWRIEIALSVNVYQLYTMK